MKTSTKNARGRLRPHTFKTYYRIQPTTMLYSAHFLQQGRSDIRDPSRRQSAQSPLPCLHCAHLTVLLREEELLCAGQVLGRSLHHHSRFLKCKITPMKVRALVNGLRASRELRATRLGSASMSCICAFFTLALEARTGFTSWLCSPPLRR